MNRQSPMKGLIKKAFRQFGFDLTRLDSTRNPDLECIADGTEADKRIVVSVMPFTMASVARIAALLDAVGYLSRNAIPGDMAECGVWRGGSMMAVALALLARNDTTRSLYLYDTFEGMVPAGDVDRSYDGKSAESQREPQWCHAGLDDVRRNLLSTGYPSDRIHFVKGRVEATIPGVIPEQLSLLRLDTDWYESTKHELAHLFPRLSDRGIMIVDDYGHWQGSRKAVDEYFQERNECVFLHRIDYTARLVVKHAASASEPARVAD